MSSDLLFLRTHLHLRIRDTPVVAEASRKSLFKIRSLILRKSSEVFSAFLSGVDKCAMNFECCKR